MSRSAHGHARPHQLAIVFVGGNHIHIVALGCRPMGHSADDIVGLIAGLLQDGDVVGFDDFFNHRHRGPNVFGRGVALCLVFGIGFVAKGRPGGVEGHGDEIGRMFGKNVFERVDKTKNGRSVFAARVDARRTYQGIIGSIDEGISI